MNYRFYGVICILVLLFLGCRQSPQGLDKFFPPSKSITHWARDGKPDSYSPETLYELINGEAELYHAYGFQNMSVLSYYSGSVEDTFLTVHIYDMGTPENAFGVYSSYRYPGYDFQTIGTEAMVSDFGLKFYQGGYFIDISYGDMIPAIQQAGLAIAKEVSSLIPDPAQKPDVIQLLPKQDQVPYSIRYVAREMLNQSFMPAGVEAKYQTGDQEVTGFVILFETTEQAQDALSKLREFYKSSGSELLETELPAEAGLAVQTKYQGVFLSRLQDDYLAGVRDVDNISDGLAVLKTICDTLK